MPGIRVYLVYDTARQMTGICRAYARYSNFLASGDSSLRCLHWQAQAPGTVQNPDSQPLTRACENAIFVKSHPAVT